MPENADDDTSDGEEVSRSDIVASDSDVEELIELLPPERRGELLQVLSHHQGWLPPPSLLAEYEAILPGLAERIVQMPEREQKHRHEVVAKETERQFCLRRWGQHYAIIGMVLLLAFGTFLALIGHPALGAMVAIGTVVAVVGIFATGKIVDAKASSIEEE